MIRFSLFTAAVVGALGFALPASAATIQFTATLSGAAEVPPVDAGSASGSATVTLDDQTHLLSWNIAYQNMTGPVTLAHFHGPATTLEGGANVLVPINLPDSGATSPITGSATIDATQEGHLLGGLLYINLHTGAHQGGEIRGQVLRQQTDGGTDGGDAGDASPDADSADARTDGDATTDGRSDADSAGGTAGSAGVGGTTGRGGTTGTGGTAGSAGRGGTTGASGAGGGGAGGRGGTSGRGGTGGSAPPADEDDGCGCRTVGESGSAAGLVGLALAGLMLSRRMSERRSRRDSASK
jgi:MYXO-CTERM domain-containing protein